MRYKISVKASDDIEKIWLYTLENWSFEQADRYIHLIFDEIEFIALNPYLGKDSNHIRKNYFCSKVKSHLIFYRVNDKSDYIEVIRVLHQRMNIENHFNE